MRHFFCLIIVVIASIKLSAQEIGDSIVHNYHFNENYNYVMDTIHKLNYHPDSLLKLASKQLGTPYVPNGKEPGGFDCTGFTFYVFKYFDIFLPYYSFQQGEVGKKIETFDAKKGDLVVFKGHDLSIDHAGHIGIVAQVEGKRIRFIHASSSHGVRFDYIDGPYFKERFMMVRRIVE
jgi:cell wall-associated NlpC family hydrolase